MKDKEKQFKEFQEFAKREFAIEIIKDNVNGKEYTFEELFGINPNKEKQIEEMASDMDYACTKRDLYPSDAKEIAKTLYLLDYRKIPKGGVVVSAEEYTELKQAKKLLEFRQEDIKFLEDANIRYAEALELKVNEKERKETAVNILSELYYIARFYYGDSAKILAWAKDKATKLGVEIKELE